MFEIIIKGVAGECNIDRRKLGDRVSEIDCQDCFSEYFHEEFRFGGQTTRNQQDLINKGVKGGYMRFSYEKNNIYVIVEYESREKLTDEELDILKRYTQGQLSDGIGEGFEQCPCLYIDGEEVYLSPWYNGQKLSVIQKEI